jgi:hypothetical protein
MTKPADPASMPDPTRAPSDRRSEEIRSDQLLDLLRRTPRVERDWAPVFAANLGEMARALSPERPKAGAKAMFDRAFGVTQAEAWRKRKRFLRLPGEEAPQFLHHGEYSATTRDYLKLAEAFADLKASHGSASAIRRLVRGTALAVHRHFELMAKGGLEEAVAHLWRLEGLLRRDADLRRAFAFLSQYPIAPFRPDEIAGDVTEDNLGAALRGGGFSLVPGAKPTAAAFPRADFQWFQPCVFLGWLYVRRPMFDVELGSADAPIMQRLKKLHESKPPEKAQKMAAALLADWLAQRLEDLGASAFWPGEEYYEDAAPIPASVCGSVFDRRSVVLVCRIEDGQPACRLVVTDAQRYRDPRGEFLGGSNFTPEVYRIGAALEDDLCLHDLSERSSLDSWGRDIWRVDDLDFDLEFATIEVDEVIHLIGGVQRQYESCAASFEPASLGDTDAMLELLALGSDPGLAVFRPAIWDDQRRLAPAPSGSIAGAILRNLAFAPEVSRLDALLVNDARARIVGLDDFIDEQFGAYERAISRLTELEDGEVVGSAAQRS